MKEDLRRGAAHAVAAAAAFAATGALVKAAAADVGNEMIVFARNGVAFVALLPWVLRSGRAGVATQRLGAHLWRAALGLTAMYCFFFALGRLPLAEAMLLNYSAPIFVPFIAWLWIGERPDRLTIPAALVGFVGVALIVKPGAGGLANPAALIGVAAGVLAAGAFVGIRRLTSSEPTTRIVFYFSALSTAGSSVPLLGSWQTPQPATALVLIGCGLSAVLGQLWMTRAYAYAPASRVAPYSYASVVFAAGLGWGLWSETLDALSLVGAALIVATCIALNRHRPPAPARDAQHATKD